MADREQQPTGLLIADSDALVRHALAEYLRHCGYRVIEAASMAEAQNVLGEGEPLTPVDILLSDVELSDGSGFALRAWAREHHPGLAVLLAGNFAAAAQAAGELCDKGPDLARPYEPQLVADRIRRSLAERARRAEG